MGPNKVACSSVVEDPFTAVDDVEAGESVTVDGVLHGDGSSGEAWYEEDDNLDIEWKLRREKHYIAGYREGLLQGQSDAAQDGFNQGFKESVMVGYKWGIIRGITSALAHLPDELKVKLVENDDTRRQLLKLHGDVSSIGTQDALKLIYADLCKDKSEKQRSNGELDPSHAHQSSSGDLDHYFEKLEVLLKQSPGVDMNLKLNGNLNF